MRCYKKQSTFMPRVLVTSQKRRLNWGYPASRFKRASLPPKRAVRGPGEGIEPRTPQNRNFMNTPSRSNRYFSNSVRDAIEGRHSVPACRAQHALGPMIAFLSRGGCKNVALPTHPAVPCQIGPAFSFGSSQGLSVTIHSAYYNRAIYIGMPDKQFSRGW